MVRTEGPKPIVRIVGFKPKVKTKGPKPMVSTKAGLKRKWSYQTKFEYFDEIYFLIK
jgi:hypothetical protein